MPVQQIYHPKREWVTVEIYVTLHYHNDNAEDIKIGRKNDKREENNESADN